MKHPVYVKVGKMLKAGAIENFQDLFVQLQKKRLIADLRMAFETLASRELDPGRLTVHELTALADLMEIDHSALFAFAILHKKTRPSRSRTTPPAKKVSPKSRKPAKKAR